MQKPTPPLLVTSTRRQPRLAFYMGCCPHRRTDRVSLGKRACAAPSSAARAGARVFVEGGSNAGRVLRVGRTVPFRRKQCVSPAPVATPATEAAAARSPSIHSDVAAPCCIACLHRNAHQTCARTVRSWFLERSRSALLMKLLSAATALLQAGQGGRRASPRRRPGTAHECPDCGVHGLLYTSYERPSGSAHRVLAWCPECLTTVEL